MTEEESETAAAGAGAEGGEVVRLRGVTVRRGDTVLLDGVDWTVRPGENWVVLGANGSGKTSLLNTLSGFLQPTAGTVEVLGHRFGETDWKPLRRRIGIINHTVGDWIQDGETALEVAVGGIHSQINYWGRMGRSDVAAAREALAACGLADAEARRWTQLSQGERQRLLIARARLARFRILILDEPCAGLDPLARHRFLDFMAGLARHREEGAPTLFLVTHHVEEITEGFSHVLLLRGGSVVATGPVREVLTAARLGEAYGCPVRLTRRGGRHALEIVAAPAG
jgi:iron complex transport system ATP-binding protein